MSADDVSTLPDLVAGRLSTAAVSDILDDLGQVGTGQGVARPAGAAKRSVLIWPARPAVPG
jgi:hypothetical protein